MRDEWTQILSEIDNVHAYAKQIGTGEIGKLRIAHPGSITHSILPDLLAALIAEHPNLEVELFELLTAEMTWAKTSYAQAKVSKEPS